MVLPCARWVSRIFISIALIGSHVFAAQPWLRLSSPNFELYTNMGEKRSGALLTRLENAHMALRHLTLYGGSNTQPMRVIAFRSQREYRPYSSDAGSAAYFLHSEQTDYIVLRADWDDAETAAVHEYAHYVLHQEFHHLPQWLDEGLADLFSTVQERDGVVRLGLRSEERWESVYWDGLAYDLPSLFQLKQRNLVDMRSTARRARFYAESWALVHMLRLSQDYYQGFDDFIREMQQGVSARQALLSVYHKSETDVRKDLEAYIEARSMPVETFHVEESAFDSTYQAYSIAPTDPSATLADLLMALHRRQFDYSARSASTGLMDAARRPGM
jgi:hypothetical protein